MNEEDSEQMGLYLQELGYEPANQLQEADVVLLNTCSVRRKPEDKAFSLLGELREAKAANPNLIIGVCGCMAQIRAADIHRRAPHVDFVVGTANIAQIPDLVRRARTERRIAPHLDLPERKGAVVSDVPKRKIERVPKLKAFVPIQYGCDKFCTFCIVPTTRGRERSRSTSDIIEEAWRLADNGTKEVILLGQTVNSYGKNLLEGNVPFARLLELLSEVPGIERIRFTSPYPRDFRADLIEQIASNPKVMEHVHLPLQSGDDAVLLGMKRVYTVAEYEAIYHELRARVPSISVTTDIIVGFPGETEAQFQRTIDAVERLRFDAAFMFAYNTRPGTRAAEMSDQVAPEVKRERLMRLIEVQNAISCSTNASQTGHTYEVLVEGPSPKDRTKQTGNTRQNKTMNFASARELAGRTVRVRAVRAHLWGYQGELA